MIKLRTDTRTPTLTAEQFSTLKDALYLFLGGESLSFMGKISGDGLLQAIASGHNHDAAYAALAHNHADVYAALAHNHADVYAALAHNHADVYAALAHNHADVYAALAHNHADVYAALAHNHDAAYAALAHNHNAAYAALSHNHTGVYVPLSNGMGVMSASWSGNGNATRTINLSYGVSITTLLLLVLMSWCNASTYGLRLWSAIFSEGYLYTISNAGCAVDNNQWTFSGGTSIDIVQNINQSSWYYRLFMLGWR